MADGAHSGGTVLIKARHACARLRPRTPQATSDMTTDIYTHAQDDAKRKALEKFEARLVQ
jgi:hypothetical protein